MRAAVLESFGKASVLGIVDYPKPEPQPNEVLIKVVAAGMNRADIAQRKGHYPAPAGAVQDILGLEVSGFIEEIGSEVTQWKVGDRVCALLPGGGYAEYASVDEGSCLPIPKGFSMLEASVLPEVLLTVWQNVFQMGQLKKGEDVLIYGGSGGIGSMAIQLVRLFGAHPYTIASDAEKIEYCKKLGAEKVVNYREENLVEAFGKNSMDLIFEMVGGDYLDQNLDLLRPEGRMVYINAMNGKGELNIFKMMQKRISITGSTLRARSLEHKRKLVDEAVRVAYPLLESSGYVKPELTVFPLEEVIRAHELMESRDFMGKISIHLDNYRDTEADASEIHSI